MRAAANARRSDLLAGAAGRPRWWWSAPSSRPPAARCRAGPAPRCRPPCPVPPNGVPERGCRAVVAVLDHSGGQGLIFPAEGRADLLVLRQQDGEDVSFDDLGGVEGPGGVVGGGSAGRLVDDPDREAGRLVSQQRREGGSQPRVRPARPGRAGRAGCLPRPLRARRPAVASAPAPTPAAPPRRASRMASDRNWTRMCPLVAPRARRRPISDRRSRTEMTMMLATPTAPTSRATAPRPRNRPLRALLASAWATSAAEGWETLTWPGFSGLAVAASSDWTAVTWLVSART